MVLAVGDQAPDFTLPDQECNKVNLSSFLGKRLIIYFYPRDNTPGCTKEACNFKENWNIFKSNDIPVLGISKDSASSHQKFIARYELPFLLLTDQEPCPVATSYDSYGLKKFMGKEFLGIIRNTFLIGKDGKIENIYKKVKAASMADIIIEDLSIN